MPGIIFPQVVQDALAHYCDLAHAGSLAIHSLRYHVLARPAGFRGQHDARRISRCRSSVDRLDCGLSGHGCEPARDGAPRRARSKLGSPPRRRRRPRISRKCSATSRRSFFPAFPTGSTPAFLATSRPIRRSPACWAIISAPAWAYWGFPGNRVRPSPSWRKSSLIGFARWWAFPAPGVA